MSAVSVWEIAIKLSIGRLKMGEEHVDRLPELIRDCDFPELAVTGQNSERFTADAHEGVVVMAGV